MGDVYEWKSSCEKEKRIGIAFGEIEVELTWLQPDEGGNGADLGLNLSAFMLNDRGHVPSDWHFVYDMNRRSLDGAVVFLGQGPDDVGSENREEVTVDLSERRSNQASGSGRPGEVNSGS